MESTSPTRMLSGSFQDSRTSTTGRVTMSSPRGAVLRSVSSRRRRGGVSMSLRMRLFSHYFCMLFTYNSSQLGADSEGLFGFYGDEVKKQIEGGKKKCKYCGKRGATAR